MPRRNRNNQQTRRPRQHRPQVGTSLEAQRRATSRRALCHPGVIAFARVPYRDKPDQYKIRPVIVVGWTDNGRTISVRPITSRTNGAVGNIDLRYWHEAGLSRPSAASAQVIELDRIDFQGAFGELHPTDRAAVGMQMAGV